MKKFIYLLMATALVWSCEKDEVLDFSIPQKPIVGKEDLSNSTLPEHLYVYTVDDEAGAEADNEADDKQSRTLVDNNKVLWHNGDNIFYCADSIIGAQYKFEGEDSTAKATFDKVGNGKSSDVLAKFPVGVFPYRDSFDAEYNDNDTIWTITPDYEQYQNYVPNSFDKDANIMIAAGKTGDNNLSFRNTCGYVVIRLYGTNVIVDRVRLFATPTGYTTSDQPRIWGKLYNIDVDANGNFTYHKLNPAGVWFQNMIELNCVDSETQQGVRISEDKNNPTEFWFAVPPMFLENGISITVIDSNGNYVNKETATSFEIERNKVKRMEAVDATNTKRTTRLWYTTTEEEPFSKFDEDTEPFKYFDAKIISHGERTNDENKKWMTCIEFDRPLTEIKKDAFKGAGLTEIIFPDALKTIGESALEGNEPLKSVTFQSNVTTVGKRAFYNNANLEVCNFSENLTTIGESAFQYTGITTPKIPAKVTLIGQNAFADCEKLTSVIFEPSTTGALITIGKGAFQYTGLTSLNIPSKVTRIEQDAFADCESLATVTFEFGNTPLTIGAQSTSVSGDSPFYDSNNITTFSLNRELVKAHNDVSMNLFEGHTKLTSVQLGEQVKTIYDEMFYNTGISSITIPGAVTRIEENAFSACGNLATVTFEPNGTETPLTIDVQSKYLNYTPFYGSDNITTLNINRELVSANDYMPMALFENHTKLANLNIGNQMTTIHEDMFNNCIGLTSVTIPGNVVTIGDYAFMYCNNLNNVTIQEGLVRERTIGKGAFQYCSKLSSITFKGIATIGDIAFSNCKNLTSLVIPGSVNVIGNNTFEECTGLKSVTFSSGEGSLIIGCITKTLAIVGDVEYGPFYHSPLTEIKLNRNVVMSDEYAEVVDGYDEGIFSYNDYSNSSHRTTLTIGSSVKRIEPWMFTGSGITSVTIPGSVTNIGDNAFYECTKLASVRFEGSATPLTIGFQPEGNERGPFYQSPLTSIYVNRELVATEEYAAARNQTDEGIFSTSFDDAVVSVILQGNVNTISDYMFSGVQMKTIWIPQEVTSIGKSAFEDCSLLHGVTLAHSAPPTLGVDAFEGTLLQDEDEDPWIALEKGSDENILKAFKTATNWSEYAGIIKPQYKTNP